MNPDWQRTVLFICDRCLRPVYDDMSWYCTDLVELCGLCVRELLDEVE